MAKDGLQEKFKLPDNCELKQEKTKLIVKGPKGELTRMLPDKQIKITQTDKDITISYEKSSQREKKNLFTTKAHIKNMFKGVQEGFTYKLKICSGHFPMSVGLKNGVFEIKNFIGEKVPRTLKIKQGADVKIEGDIVTVYAIDKEIAGMTAGAIEKLTRRPGFDKRIFQDGIYITDKDGKKLS
ncbi:MAG: 50S ribosomal protein L6 [Candidatus Woesearchaeota archaeon]|jgi:large subunit ribosomal protein L6